MLSFTLDTSNWPVLFITPSSAPAQHDKRGGTFCIKGEQFALKEEYPGWPCALGQGVSGDIMCLGTKLWYKQVEAANVNLGVGGGAKSVAK